MCTLIVLHRCVESAPLVVAANRDEFYTRPSEGLAVREGSGGPVLVPRDARAGGTWLGLNARGVFAALTNRRCESPDPSRRSRGSIVYSALAEDSAERAACAVARLEARAFNPFNLFVADSEKAFVISYEDVAEQMDMPPGVHVIGNVHPRERTEKIERLRAAAERSSRSERPLENLEEICRSHDGEDALGAACVHTIGYGTRSSTLLQLHTNPGMDVLRHAGGAPCRERYRDFTPLLRDLGPGSRLCEGASSARKVS